MLNEDQKTMETKVLDPVNEATSFAKKEEEKEEPKAEYKKDEKEEKPETKEDKPAGAEDKDKEDETNKDDNDDKKNKDKYSLLSEQYEALTTQYNNLQTQYKELVSFKNKVEDKQKDDLINSFYMLSEEDKKDVKQNKSIYSLDDIKAKLSIICVDKKVNFDLDTTSKTTNTEVPGVTYNLSEPGTSAPDWISAVKLMQSKRMN